MKIAQEHNLSKRKSDFVALGQWGAATGRGWLVRALHRALIREGLVHA